jgi:chitodextrinase
LGRTYDIQTYTFPGSEPDATPPTPPTAVTATAVSTSTINVSWSGATDNVGVTGYHLFRDGVQIADQAGTSFTDSTASPDTSYSYTVVAVDAAGNVSAASAAATVSTSGAADGTAPSTPGNVTATAASSSQVNLTWTASTDNIGVTGYHVYRNGTQLQTPTPPDATPPTAYTDDTAQPGTAYTYQVSAVDAAGNESPRASATVSTPSAGGTLTFTPTDDATVDSSQPAVNLGTNSRLTVDNSPINYSLLKFTVAGTGGCPITAAKLQLTVGNGTDDKSPYGGDVYGTTTSTWTQPTVTWNTAPVAGATKVGSVPTAVSLSTSYLFDVTPLVTGDGTVSMLIKSTSSDGARYYSKEGGTPSQAPQLQVTCG